MHYMNFQDHEYTRHDVKCKLESKLISSILTINTTVNISCSCKLYKDQNNITLNCSTIIYKHKLGGKVKKLFYIEQCHSTKKRIPPLITKHK